MLAAATDKTDIALAAFERANQRAGDVLLGKALGFFSADPALDVNGAIGPDTCGLGELWLLVWIYISHMEFRRKVVIPVQQVARPAKLSCLIEISDVDVVFQTLDDLRSLFGQTEALVRRRIKRFVVPVSQPVGCS